jgi:hypothetical protein
MPFERCYMCSKRATTREHVPPLALFPKTSEVGRNYRSNLITVPSCAEHNTAKSDDDEFLMASLAGTHRNNEIGFLHKLTKVERAIKRNRTLMDRVILKKEELYRFEHAGKFTHQILWGKPDLPRLNKCFDRIARGLHLYHFGTRFKGRVMMHPAFLRFDNQGRETFNEFLKHRTEIDLRGKPSIGANPDVFFFQVTDPDRFGIYMARLCFYGGVEVYTVFLPKGSEQPYNLAVELMNRGIPTTFRLEGKDYFVNMQE